MKLREYAPVQREGPERAYKRKGKEEEKKKIYMYFLGNGKKQDPVNEVKPSLNVLSVSV